MKRLVKQLAKWREMSVRMAVMLVMLMGISMYAKAEEYITEIMVLGADDSGGINNVAKQYRESGWTVVTSDLNSGTGGWYIYLAYKTSSSADPRTGYVTDVCISTSDVSTFTYDGRTYHQASRNSGFNGNLNRGTGSSTPNFWLYYTRDRNNLSSISSNGGGTKRVMTKLSVSHSSNGGQNTEYVGWLKSSYGGPADTNKGAGGDFNFIHKHLTTQTLKWKQEPTFASNLTYNGSSQSLIAHDPWRENYGFGNTQFRLNDGNWSYSVPGGTNVGNYKVDAILVGVDDGLTFANNSPIVSKTVTINPPIAKASNLKGVFNQRDKKVYLSWYAPYIDGRYSDYKWVVYRDGTKIAERSYGTCSYSDSGFTNEATPVYDVYYVSNFWEITTKRDDTKASVTVNTTRSVPIHNVMVDQQSDRIVFTWTSDAYPAGFGNKFRIYANNEEDPIYELTPADMQSAFQWEHRTTDQHTNRQNKVDAETGVPYTEEPLSACNPRAYRIDGVIGDVVLNSFDISPKSIGEATKFYGLDASKGVYEGSVKLAWQVDQQGSVYAKTYIIERRRAEQETEAWETLTRLSSTEEYLFYTDETALPGVYYDYRVTIEDKCPDGSIVNSEATNIGFAKSTGTVTGRVAYGSTGTAVKGVEVVMTITDSEGEEAEQYHSIYFSDATGAVTWQYPSEDYAAELFSGNFSMQLWLYPELFSNSLIAHFGGNTGLGMTDDGHLTFSDGTTTHTFDSIILQQEKYNHVALTYSGTTLRCYVLSGIDGDSIQKDSLTLDNSQWPLTGVKRFELGHFKGAVDEFRLWKKCLSENDIKDNYDHLLLGNEQQLETYWTFDEGLRTQFFDYSRDGSNYNKHHGLVGSNAMSSTLTPKALKLKAKTDANGNYIIQGIPFSGAGTTYSVVPLYGIHEFNPNMMLRYIGANSLVHTADFEDVSSFMMTGHIYYLGTNIPVEGVQFAVDGELQSSEGAFVVTDANGYYSLSVPIGEHYVEAKLPGHTMVAGGRYPTVGKINFTDRVQHDFLDSTLVNFVGRVAGGTANDTLPVGFRASKNNIGTATVTLRLNNESFSFNVQDKDHITPATTDRSFESDTSSIQSNAWTAHGAAESKYIYITTDSATGEFSAKLPPLKYIVRSIVVDSNETVEFLSLPEIDLTSVQKVLKDSMKIETEEGDSVWNYFSYNTKMIQTYFAEPQVSLWQMNGDGGFGEKELKDYAISRAETMDITDIWTKDEEGKIHYTYGFPVFGRQMKYRFGLFGYEAYTNYDSGKAVTDTIPMNGQVLTVANEMSNEQDVVARVIDPTLTNLKEGDIYNLKSNQVRLDETGKNEITFITGAPNVTAPYTRQFSIAFVRNKRTYTGPQLNGVVLGELTNGNNFVTQGPDHVDMVLRDPPGAKSKTTWKTGKSWTKIENRSDGFYSKESLLFDLIWGVDVVNVVGMGVAIVNTSKATTSMVVGATGNYSYTKKKEKTYVYTEASNISTSTGSKYVGADGDIFIGKSHNFIIGTCRKLGFHHEGDSIVLGLKEAVSVNDSIATDFMFTTREIKETMIPKTIETRNALLEYMNEAAAKAFTNTTDQDIYLTWLTPDDEHYGQDSTYVWKPGVNGNSQDLVLHYNESVRLWKQRLAENEKDKIEAIQGTQYFKENRSFDGGTSYTYSTRRDTTNVSTETHSGSVGVVYEVKHAMRCRLVSADFGTNWNLKTENGYTGSSVEGDSLDNTKSYVELDYELNDGNPGTDFTVDIYRSPRGWSDLFLLRGGQSYNPYEGMEYAQYYEPESQHVISYGTQQMEQPIIQISTDGNIGAKTATLTDVPAGLEGQFTLHVTNGSTTNQTIPFGYDLKISEITNTKGLEILMDGTPINDRTLWIPKGETVKKIITVRQTDQSVLDYDSVELYLYSMYQPAKINDHVTLGVHFMPSSSPVTLSVTNPVINTDPTTGKGKLSLKLSGFNRQFKNLKNIGIQYRFAGNTQWTTLHTWVTNIADSTSKSFSSLPTTGDIRWTEDMSNNTSYPEGEYEFRAFTTTPYGNEPVQVFSETTKVIKDMTLPRPLFTPAPTNGILGIGEQLAVEFNEDIVPGYVGDKNIIITAKLNGRPINHDVSLHLLPFGQEVQTVNPVFLNGNFSLEFWVNLHESGIILHQGAGNGNFALSLDNDGHMVVSVVGKSFTSKATLPKDKWAFIAMNYKAQTMTFNMLAQYGDLTISLFSNETVPMEQVEVVDYTEDNHLYLGPINANIHALALYNIYRDVTVAASSMYVSKDAYTYGLTNYWPMNEGHGFVAADTRRTHDFEVKDSWTISNVNYALRTDTTAGAKVDISLINTNHDESYAIEMWYQSSILNVDTLFETDNLRLRFDSTHNLVLDYGTKSKTVAARADFDNLTIGWHHVALNVVRGQAASFYLDGKRTAVIAEADVPTLKGATLSLIKGGEFGYLDELRIWKATLSEDRLLSNMYNTIDTSDVYARGLVAYYPFEKDSTINGEDTKGETLQNMAPKSKTGNAGDVLVTKHVMLQSTPPLKNAPSETRITAVPVASERKVVINLANTEVNARDIEGTTLNVTLAEIHDLHGNISNPIKWTAYVQQNTLKWLKDSVNITKKYGDDYTFDVHIENLSGQIEYYTIANMPEWLTLDGSLNEDDVQPLKTKTLRFKVNPYVPVNDYDVTIGLQGNNEILEPLRIVMKVRGETPNWNVDPTLYDHSMTVIGQVYLGGILMENPESMVAAFIGGECRGVATPEKTRGAAFVTLPIYGHDTSKKDAGKAISFRIWDASRGVAYTDAVIRVPNANANANADTTLVFHDGVLVGNFDYPAIWTKSDKVEQLISVHENWNWIALGVEPENPTCTQLFKDYMGWNILVKDTGSYSQTNGSEWKGSLAPHANRMYKMKIARTPATQSAELDPQLAVRGQQKALYEMPVYLEKGWNWMPYTPLTTKRIEPALAGANPKKGDIVKSQTAVAIYGTDSWEGTLTALEPGHGYLYFSTDSMPRSFIYPEETYVPNGMLGTPMRNVKSQMSNLQWFNPVDKHNYPSNMTMTIRLLDGEAVVDTCEIAAFVEDECRGAIRADEEGLYYIVIAGEGAGQAMEIKAFLNGEIVTIDNTLTFTSDDHIGTPWEPYIINLQQAEGIDLISTDDVNANRPYKVIEDNHLFIIRGNDRYDATGQRVK